MKELSLEKIRKRRRHFVQDLKTASVWAFQIFVVCLFAFVLVWYFGQRISTVGDSMKPILYNGDIVLVNRIIYDAKNPKRGEIVVFKPNGNENSHDYIKRVIGLPGERIQILDGEILINGEKLSESYETTALEDAGIAAEEVTLGKDEYFVLGDNRLSSEDSRNADVGFVKKEYLEGRAWFIIGPKEHFGFIKSK